MNKDKKKHGAILTFQKRRHQQRRERRVSTLARQHNLEWVDVIKKLRHFNIQVNGPSDLVPRRDLVHAIQVLKEKNQSTSQKLEKEKPYVKTPTSHTQTQVAEPSAPKKKSKVPNRILRQRLVGRKDLYISYLSIRDVLKVHEELVKDFQNSNDPIDPPGVKDETLLGSAVNRPHTSIGAELKYPTVYMVAAAYLHALIGNHPFHNGNKRTALVSTLAFLSLNNITLDGIDQNDLFNYVIGIAAHKITNIDSNPLVPIADREVLAIAEWVRNKSRKIDKTEKILKFHELESILKNYDVVIEKKPGNKVVCKRASLVSHIGHRNDGDEMDRETVRRVRKELNLTEQDGIDSITFYKAGDRIPEFINKYRAILQNLANA